MQKLIVVVLFVFANLNCSGNNRAKNWGGTQTLKLAPGIKLENITWKAGEIWYLTRAMRPGEEPETHEFHEESSFGIVEGKVIVVESKKEASTTK